MVVLLRLLVLSTWHIGLFIDFHSAHVQLLDALIHRVLLGLRNVSPGILYHLLAFGSRACHWRNNILNGTSLKLSWSLSMELIASNSFFVLYLFWMVVKDFILGRIRHTYALVTIATLLDILLTREFVKLQKAVDIALVDTLYLLLMQLYHLVLLLKLKSLASTIEDVIYIGQGLVEGVLPDVVESHFSSRIIRSWQTLERVDELEGGVVLLLIIRIRIQILCRLLSISRHEQHEFRSLEGAVSPTHRVVSAAIVLFSHFLLQLLCQLEFLL